jgi:poly-gamma-glutamate capsule biosynthesis protein CapA/YwtB (metallophosphatase superfamily)
MSKEITLFAVGDVAPKRENPHTIFDSVRTLLKSGDLGFCQLEAALSKQGTPLPQARLPMRTDPEVAAAIKAAGFGVVSFAGNHCMDWGREAFFDTLENLKGQGIAVIGVGENIQAARQAAIIEKNGTRIAFLAYNTILPQCYWAETDRPGCTPLRAVTVYEQIEHDQPGTPCRIHSAPQQKDLLAMAADIEAAKKSADVVIVSMHWGIHFVPAQLADYQREMAHTAVDHGADLILGHHPHILKGIEVYRGKVIFYSLGNFAIEQPSAFMDGLHDSQRHKEIEALNPNWQKDRPYAPPPDTRKTMVVKCTISDGRLRQVAFQPSLISIEAVPELLLPTDENFQEVIDYLLTISHNQGLYPKFDLNDQLIVIDTHCKEC